jgi:predicted metalloprotease with PDZ domain
MLRCATAAFFVLACDSGGGDRQPPTPPQTFAIELPREAASDALEYTVKLNEPDVHYAEVQVLVPVDRDQIELMMAVWTPGSYVVQEYARHVENVLASTMDGDALTVQKVSKNRWRIATRSEQRIAVRYQVYCRELTVRTNFVDDSMAILNGAPTFLTLAHDRDRPHDVRIVVPESWNVVTSLRRHPSGGEHRYLARDYDELVDSPIAIGTPALHEFTAGGRPHTLANFGEDRLWDGDRSAADLERVVRATQTFWQDVPYDRYVFMNLIAEGRGGLEHRASTVMMTHSFATRNEDDYLDWLGLASHEFFHLWNVKRLRPAELGPFDYESENYTTSLWIVEGLTSYYDDLLLVRAGLMEIDEYLERLSAQIEAVQRAPGRFVQPLSRASFDAWIKYYRPDENSENSSVSYYKKGAIVGFLLDAAIRMDTHLERSLDDVMRLAYTRFSAEQGYTEAEFRALIDEVATEELAPFLARAVDGTDELDYTEALELYGLRFETIEEDEVPHAQLGAAVENDRGRLVVVAVPRDTPAHAAGLNVGDEILAIDGRRVEETDLDEHLRYYRPEDDATLLISRRRRIRELPIRFGGSVAEPTWKLERVERPTMAQRRAFAAWLAVPEEDPGAPAGSAIDD